MSPAARQSRVRRPKSSRHSRRKTWQPEFGTARQQSGSHRSIRQCGPTRLAEIYTVCRRSRHLSGPWGGTPLAPPTRRSWQTSAARHNRCFGLGKRHDGPPEGTIEGLRALSRQLISELSSRGLLRKPTAPALIARTRNFSSGNPVTKMIGIP